ncbi:MAG: TonB-dependent receptor [Xanthomonadales bacterium]|nr:TonB-dependent receptor [Xanthomonadales bacterium]NIX11995.1 TonB-dependent receptor [Xanthomonadales bacterium]
MNHRTILWHAFIGACFAMAGPVMAQTDQAVDAEEAESIVEEILVTGSRLRRDSFNIPTPLVTLDNQAIQDTGLNSLAEVLIDEMPAVFESASNTNGQSYVNATGLTTMSLRNQGTDRTLVLIDGRRTVPNQYGGNAVSLNTIPTPLIQRVEIITGGSSAAYGSDAIAGVVNIITQQDKVGLAVEARYGATYNGGGEEYSADVQYGANFAEGRGYLFFGATFDDQKGIGPYERDRALIEADFDYNTTLLCNEMQVVGGDQCLRDIPGGPELWRNRSDGMPGGVFEERSSSTRGYWYDETGLRDDWNEEQYGIHTQQFVQLKIPEDRYTAALKTTFDFENNVKGTFQMMYSENNSFNIKSPEDEYEGADVIILDPVTGEPGEVRPGYISIDNPFAPAEIAENAGSSISWDRRFFEVGNIMTDNHRTTFRSWAGLQGEFANDWQWDVSLGYGKSRQRQLRHNELDVVKEAQALDAEYAEDGVTIQCADPEARAAGCVPLNIFGVGSITPEMADWIRVEPEIRSDIEQKNLLAYVSGDLFEMSNGPVPAVFGVEYREDSLDLGTSEGHQYGGITFNLVPQFSGSIDVWEAFTEMAFPLTDTFSAEVSARVADYSPAGIDTVVSYTTGLMWEPAEGYRLRANIARAQRAPTIAELFSPPRGDFDSIFDICDGTTLDSTDPGHANCRLEPGIMATIGIDGVFTDEGNNYSPNAGNPEVFEETADTYTIGFSMNPSWAENLRLAVDYWDITIEDKITSIGNQEILEQCYNSSVAFGPDNPFCNLIRRDGDGYLIEVMQRQYNLNEGKTRGVDVAMDYNWDLGAKGDITFKLDWTHMLEDSDTYEGLDGLVTVDFTGQLDYGNFDDRATLSATWRKDDWRVRWTTKYKSSVADNYDRNEEWEALRTRNDERCASGDSRCITNPEVPLYLFYPAYTKHDLSVSYSMRTDLIEDLRLYAGVKNVFDDMGPFMPTGGDTYESGPGNFDSKYDGGVGRFWYVGAEMSFGQ